MQVPRVGRCNVCGRQVPGILLKGSLRQCEDPCPRCGADPFFLDNIGPYSGNVAKMTIVEVAAFAQELEDTAEIEVCFRLEIMGHWPDGRDAALEALYARYWEVAFIEDPAIRARIMPLSEARVAWRKHLASPEEMRHYSNLVLVPNGDNQAPGSKQAEV